MFNEEKRIDFTRAYELAKQEFKDVRDLAREEAEEIAQIIKTEEEKLTEGLKETGAEVVGAVVRTEEKVVEEVKQVYNSIPAVKARKEKKMLARRLRLFAPLLIGMAVLVIVLIGIALFNFAGIFIESMKGKGELEQAVNLIKQGNFEGALTLSKDAEMNFNNAMVKADEMNNSVISYLPLVGRSAEDVKYLTTTANILARTVSEGVVISREMNSFINKSNTNFSKYSPEEKGRIIQYLYQSGPELVGLKANLDLASLNLEKIQFGLLLTPFKGKVENLKSQVDLGRVFLARAIPAAKFLPELAGYPEKKNFLFLLQNNDELRPAGGFIGNYGILATQNGDILSFDTKDSYHLDMPVQDKLNVDPPAALKEYLVPKWYFRDSNWSPDFTRSARIAEWFFKQENGLAKEKVNDKFDGIIAITPKFVTDLLAITGPIEMEGHEYNQDNFNELLEYRVEQGYRELGEREWNRKEMVGKIASELKIRLFDLPLNQWPEIFKVIDNNIAEKNIAVYFNDCDLERIAIEEGLAGEMKPVQNDYLMVVDANLGAFKTDAVMNKNLAYEVREQNGKLIAKVTASYANMGTHDWRTTDYRTYTRVFVPAGAKLLASSGFDSAVEAGQDEENLPAGCAGKTNDKIYFGGLIIVSPGKMKNVTLEYELPSGVYEKLRQDGYALSLQKQPGNRVSEAQVDLEFSRPVKDFSPSGFSTEKNGQGSIGWKSDLNTDKMFQVSFE